MPPRPPSPPRPVHCYSRPVSTLAPAQTRATHEPAGAASRSGARRVGLLADVVLGVALAAGFGLIVFTATGGTDLAPNTWVEIALAAVGAASAIALILLGARGPAWGALTLILFAALAALTYLSISWSVQPANSWVEANRTLAYLAAFGAAVVLARIAPARWPALVWAVGTVAVVVSGYALLAKVFPGSLNAGDQLGRLRVPFSYWNATGLMAGLGLPACLWAGARPGASRAVRALTVPAIAVLLTVLILSYSRGALIAVVVGLGVWFVLVPYRLRATLLLALGAIGGAVATGWALSHHAITHDGATLAARTSAGHEYGVVLLATLAGSALIGLTAAYATDRLELARARAPADRHRPGGARGAGPRCGRRRHGGFVARADRRDLARVALADQRERHTAGQQPGSDRRARQQPPAVLERGAQGRRARPPRRRRRRRFRHRPHPIQQQHAGRRPRPQLPDRDVR